jgi:hypothetical protein
MQPYQVLCAFDATFAAALLEAATQAHADQSPVLMLAFDSEYPEPLFTCRPIPDVGGIGFVVSPIRTPRARAALHLELETASSEESSPYRDQHARVSAAGTTAVAGMSLADISRSIPALAGLPLLSALAKGHLAKVRLPYLSGQTVAVEVQPC